MTLRHRSTILLVAIVAFGLLSFASAPVANVSSTQSFALDGHAITTAGVTSWPVVVGDEITTAAAPALMSFPDGSRLQLAPRSQAKIGGTVDRPKVLLTAGNMQYKLAPGSALSLVSTNAPAPANAGNNAPSPSPQGPATVEVHNEHAFWLEGFLFVIALTALAIAVYDLTHLGFMSPP